MKRKVTRIEIYQKLYRTKIDATKIECPAHVKDLVKKYLNMVVDGEEDVVYEASKEHFITLYLNTKNYINSIETISTGTLNASLVHPREVFKSAILSNANGLILCHNHPSGNPYPSQEDKLLTERLIEAGKILGIGILDHVIVAGDSYYSFKENGDI